LRHARNPGEPPDGDADSQGCSHDHQQKCGSHSTSVNRAILSVSSAIAFITPSRRSSGLFLGERDLQSARPSLTHLTSGQWLAPLAVSPSFQRDGPDASDRPRRQDAIDLSFSADATGVYAALISTRLARVSGAIGTVILSIPF
jgi:hypothetical protein